MTCPKCGAQNAGTETPYEGDFNLKISYDCPECGYWKQTLSKV